MANPSTHSSTLIYWSQCFKLHVDDQGLTEGGGSTRRTNDNIFDILTFHKIGRGLILLQLLLGGGCLLPCIWKGRGPRLKDGKIRTQKGGTPWYQSEGFVLQNRKCYLKIYHMWKLQKEVNAGEIGKQKERRSDVAWGGWDIGQFIKEVNDDMVILGWRLSERGKCNTSKTTKKTP